jgi:hypothetical protein
VGCPHTIVSSATCDSVTQQHSYLCWTQHPTLSVSSNIIASYCPERSRSAGVFGRLLSLTSRKTLPSRVKSVNHDRNKIVCSSSHLLLLLYPEYQNSLDASKRRWWFTCRNPQIIDYKITPIKVKRSNHSKQNLRSFSIGFGYMFRPLYKKHSRHNITCPYMVLYLCFFLVSHLKNSHIIPNKF